MIRTLDHWQREIGNWGRRKGWVFEERDIPEKLCLIHSEVSEALEEYRRGRMSLYHSVTEAGDKPEGFGIELADAAIRILHLCDHLGLSLESLIEAKMTYNDRRPFRHGNLKA